MIIIVMGFGFKYLIEGDITHTKNALKNLIIKLFLPVLIFTAFTKISPHMHVTAYPIFAISFSLFVFIFLKLFLQTISPESHHYTQVILLSSVAPGLSVYPFIITFMSKAELADAALLDFGEKLFIFIFLYFITYYFIGKTFKTSVENDEKSPVNVKTALKNIISEPVNIVIMIGVILILFKIEIASISPSLAAILTDIGNTTVTLVMLFIGMSIKKNEIACSLKSFFLLILRSGLGMLFTGIFCFTTGMVDKKTTLLFLVFTQGSISFWPYANMIYLNKIYKNNFYHEDLAIELLAYSFPMTVMLMLLMFNMSYIFSDRLLITIAGAAVVGFSTIGYVIVEKTGLCKV